MIYQLVLGKIGITGWIIMPSASFTVHYLYTFRYVKVMIADFIDEAVKLFQMTLIDLRMTYKMEALFSTRNHLTLTATLHFG